MKTRLCYFFLYVLLFLCICFLGHGESKERIQLNKDLNICFTDGGYNLASGLYQPMSEFVCSKSMLPANVLEYIHYTDDKAIYLCFYNKDKYVGYYTDGLYYDEKGERKESIRFDTFSITVNSSYDEGLANYASKVYLDFGKLNYIEKHVSSIVELDEALCEARAMANPCNIYKVYIDSGYYKVFDEYDLNKISGTGDTVGNRGLEIPTYCNLIGEGTVVLDLTVPEEQDQYATLLSTINLNGGECNISNITFYCNNGRYCVHDDANVNCFDSITTFTNCIFIYEGRPKFDENRVAYCYGAGKFGGEKVIFKNCVFRKGNGYGRWAGIYVHSREKEHMKTPCNVEIINCSFEGDGCAVILQTTPDTIDYPIVCSINGFFGGGEIELEGPKPVRLFIGGNTSVKINNLSNSTVYY